MYMARERLAASVARSALHPNGRFCADTRPFGLLGLQPQQGNRAAPSLRRTEPAESRRFRPFA